MKAYCVDLPTEKKKRSHRIEYLVSPYYAMCKCIWLGFIILLMSTQTAEERHASLKKLRRYSPSDIGEVSPLPGYMSYGKTGTNLKCSTRLIPHTAKAALFA